MKCLLGLLLGTVAQAASQAHEFSLFITGYELGKLKPCGCSGGQLGGLARRSSVLNQIPRERRWVLHTGGLVGQAFEQDLMKARILFQAYQTLGYDLVNLNAQDFENALHLGVLFEDLGFTQFLNASGQAYQVPQIWTQPMLLGEKSVLLHTISANGLQVRNDQLEPLLTTRDAAPELLLVILSDADEDAQQRLKAHTEGIDIIVLPSDSEEPMLLSDPNTRPLVCNPGRYGRYIVQLILTWNEQRAQVDIRMLTHEVSEDLPKNPELVDLYRNYQDLVGASELLARHFKRPLPYELEYQGNKSCQSCHEAEYRIWNTQKHAIAYETLVKGNSHLDPECVGCHVVGLDYETGFTLIEQTPELKGVGCEQCHGPGSEHNRTLGQSPMPQPKALCLDCHSPEHSGGYAGHEAEFHKKIQHWKEPKATNNVQEQ